MHYLYKIMDSLNNKVYIGQTVDTNARWLKHKSYARSGNPVQYIHRAIAKYGIENFTFEVIASCKTQDDVNILEDVVIQQYDSRNKELGYNLNAGGFNGSHAEETKQKIREATFKQIAEKGHPALGTKRTEEEKAKMKEIQLNRNLDYTPEIRQKMSESHIGIKDSEETKLKKALKAKLRWDKRKKEMAAAGELKCNAPNCDVVNIPRFYFVNGIKYCSKHAQRLKNTGSTELQH